MDKKHINKDDVFSLIGDRWMLVAATDKDGKTNAMTASWGGLGVLWGKKVAFVFIRPQRYTKKFVDDAENFSLSFFEESYKPMLGYMGKVSGKNKDKIKKSGLTVQYKDGAPVFKEASLTLVCRKMYRQTLEEDCFVDKTNIGKWYPQKDYHDMYVAEIVDEIIR